MNTGTLTATVGLVMAAWVPVPTMVIHNVTQEQVTVTITDKERVSNRDMSKYLIFTEHEVFENVDSMLAWKFDSSDVYGHIKIGSTCTFNVTGFRIPFLSTYRNILVANCNL